MIKKIVCLTLSLSLLLFSMVARSSAMPERTPGVVAGEWFKCGEILITFSSNDPNATIPPYLEDENKTDWLLLSVTDVSGTNVTGQITQHFENGTEKTTGGYVDVDTGTGENLTLWVLATNLGENDSLYTSVMYDTLRINETILRTYPDSVRDTNHLNMTYEYSPVPSTTFSTSWNYYWDRLTGVMVEASGVYTNQTGAYLTTWTELVKITDSNVWTVPEFPTWASILVLFGSLICVAAVIHRRKPFRTPTN